MADADAGTTRDDLTLTLPTDETAFPAAVRLFAGRVDLALHADDGMYAKGDDVHYLTCGASALNVVLAALRLADISEPRAVLDFGSGAGRVTRWLRAAFPEAALDCCDLRAEDLIFCRERYRAETWVSGTDVDALAAPRSYDLIWLGSVLTHLSAPTCRRLLAKVLGWTRPGGLVVVSTIGRTGKAAQERDGLFIDPAGWATIAAAFADEDFGYADYADHDGYGLSLIKPSWSARLAETTPGARLVLLAEKAWDGLHDILALQNDATITALAPGDRRDAEIAALKARVAALESSTSWRITAPLRRLAGWGRTTTAR